ncbi:MAG TPA: DUF1385 domain-containing protein [Oscillospiraceae bacterium]|nr:DUF1385 domain-containing protein [Oscillospiraceae bacterium]HPF56721.1 DUF1385 domain-containing protein [Clostridiales bacterium]HPK35413.1 DUF1385 domain-containing protein [Oscillospiraceae bacterium]HPR75294.1 DUF1385 domain-containing protein [Oscillospiraceae bacterium]
MAKEKKKACNYAPVGGQALMGGIMMRANSTKQNAFVVRLPNGGLFIEKSPSVSARDKHKWLKTPVIRGIVAFIESMKVGYAALNRSIELTFPEDEEAEKMTEKQKKKDETLMSAAVWLGGALGIVAAIFLMFWLPNFLVVDVIGKLVGDLGIWKGLAEGVLKLIIYVGYLLLCTLNKEIKKVFMYHGAEHKTIFCYENNLPLTVENVKKQKRFHPRCGTSFLFLMLAIGIVVYTFVRFDNVTASNALNSLITVGVKLLLLPIIMGLGFELLQFCGKHDNLLTTIISAPGLWFQRITTKEPDDDGILEVGIASLQAALNLEITVPVDPPVKAEQQPAESIESAEIRE